MPSPKITVYDHNTHPIWSVIYRTKFVCKKRINGAFTYSEDISKYHVPVIEDVLNNQERYKNIIISTVAKIEPQVIPHKTDLIICYLHENIEGEIPKCINVRKWYPNDIIYVTSRKPLYDELRKNGFEAVFIPMAIDTSQFAEYAKNEKYGDKRVIYFGNKYMGKDKYFKPTKQAFLDKGWEFDEISENMFNNNGIRLDRDIIFHIISRYKYGIGGGRCILEMAAMGLKTLVSLYANQGLVMNDEDFEIQKACNFAGGQVWTFSPDLSKCIDNFDKSIIRTVDVHDILPQLKQQLKAIIGENDAR